MNIGMTDMSDSCSPSSHESHENCGHSKGRIDWFFWICSAVVALSYSLHLFLPHAYGIRWIAEFSHGSFELMNSMWWGLVLGIIFVGVLSKVPQAFVTFLIGKGGSKRGVIRATFAGLLVDLCSHGILLVAMKLYQRGASLGQVMAFLIASPWNSISLTIILIALIGWAWTLTFIILSMFIAVISGFMFDALVRREILPFNPHQVDLPQDFKFWRETKRQFKGAQFDGQFFKDISMGGFSESRMILRWIFLGVIIASLMRTFLTVDQYVYLFGPTAIGLAVTVAFSTILEVCSEGTTPIAADIFNRAHAPGNSFTFLMAGVSTDYTEIMALRETTKSWKISLFLPLVTLPQIVLVGLLLNYLA